MSPHPRLSLNQATVKYAPLSEALDAARRAGIPSVGLWREPVAAVGLDTACRSLRDSGRRFSSLCRGGFFTAVGAEERRQALAENARAIAETAALAASGAEGSAAVLVLVAGGLPPGSKDLAGARARVGEALADLAPIATDAGVTLAIEALHPMYVADRAVVSTLGQALDVALALPPSVGVVVDTFHVWWDPDVLAQVARAGAAGRIASFQVCDWLTPIAADPLLSRGYPGDGDIDFGPLVTAVEEAGYRGDIEVEIFNQAVWDADVDTVVRRVVESFPVPAEGPVSLQTR